MAKILFMKLSEVSPKQHRFSQDLKLPNGITLRFSILVSGFTLFTGHEGP
jgi:hypothetical protein